MTILPLKIQKPDLAQYLGAGLLALVLYIPGFWWGTPQATANDRTHSWAVDAPVPLGPLAEMHNILHPKPDRLLGYPMMHNFIVSAAYAPYLAYLWAAGELSGMTAQYPFGLADPVGTLKKLTWIAHSVSVLMGAGIAVAAYDAGRILWNNRTGLLAAVSTMLSFPMFYYSRTGNVDVPVLFFIAMALCVYARILAYGYTLRRAVWLGLFIGFALATKEPAFASFIAIPVVLAAIEWRNRKAITRTFWLFSLAGTVTAIAAYGAGGGLFVDPDRFFAHIRFIQERSQALAAGNTLVRTFPLTWDGQIQLSLALLGHLADALTLGGVLLACAGMAWLLAERSTTFLFAIPAFTYLAVIFSTVRATQLRYIMPAAFTFAIFEAVAVEKLVKSRFPIIRVAGGVAAASVLGIALLRGMDLTHAMIQDSRFAAGAWLEEHTQAGDRVETFGPIPLLPPLKAGIIAEQSTQFLGLMHQPRIDSQALHEIREGLRRRNPKYILILPDYTSAPGEPYSGYCPPRIYHELLEGALGYKLAAYFQTPAFLPGIGRPALDYPTVNPPIRIFTREGRATLQ